MWWYYKCVNLVRVLIQGSKVILCVTWKCLARAAAQAGLRPVPTLWLDQPPLGMSKKTDCLKRRASGAPSLSLLLALWLSWTWLEHLWNSAKLRPPTRAGPLDSHLENQPFMKSKTVPKPQNHGATNSTTAEQRAFPVTSRSRGFSEGAWTDHVKPETKNSRGKTKPTHPACFKPTESK